MGLIEIENAVLKTIWKQQNTAVIFEVVPLHVHILKVAETQVVWLLIFILNLNISPSK